MKMTTTVTRHLSRMILMGIVYSFVLKSYASHCDELSLSTCIKAADKLMYVGVDGNYNIYTETDDMCDDNICWSIRVTFNKDDAPNTKQDAIIQGRETLRQLQTINGCSKIGSVYFCRYSPGNVLMTCHE